MAVDRKTGGPAVTDRVLGMLLQDVLAHPDDDGPRLAYADRCLELGDDARAEFIRAQCELAGPESFTGRAGRDVGRREALRRRERELLEAHGGGWVPGVAGLATFGPAPGTAGGRFGWLEKHRGSDSVAFPGAFRRGFVGEVSLACDGWLRYGPAMVRAAPLMRVALTDKEPTGYPADSSVKAYRRWFDGSRAVGPDSCDPDELPAPLWPFYAAEMTRRRQTWEHPSRADALDVLSTACLGFARAVAPAGPVPLH